MNRISDLQTVFSGSAKPDATDATARSLRQASVGGGTVNGTLLGNATLDSSSVSSAGGTLLAALNQSDVRTDKVAQLQSAIAAGTYKVSSSDVADSLIQSMLGKR